MTEPKPFLLRGAARPRRAALFLSGRGSNAEALLLDLASRPADYAVSCLVTDSPERSRAKDLAERFGLPLVEHDLKAFYAAHGVSTTSLATQDGRRLRECWTAELRRKLAGYRIDFGIMAGFMTLCNIAEDFPCLNVHPGDLTQTDEAGRRIFAGLHCGPVERALCDPGQTCLRSSVILVRPFRGDGAADMDTGYVLGVSEPVPMDRAGRTAEEWGGLRARRTPGERVDDDLRALALKNIEKLKTDGDHVVLPAAVRAFAADRYAARDGRLFFQQMPSGAFRAVRTVEFPAKGECRPWF